MAAFRRLHRHLSRRNVVNDSFHSPRHGQRDFSSSVASADDKPYLRISQARRIRPVRLAPPWQWTTTGGLRRARRRSSRRSPLRPTPAPGCSRRRAERPRAGWGDRRSSCRRGTTTGRRGRGPHRRPRRDPPQTPQSAISVGPRRGPSGVSDAPVSPSKRIVRSWRSCARYVRRPSGVVICP